jgi:G3E family GTPase
MQLRFVLVGGFLGAGKTTAIARLASMYLEQGKRVGVVTNDQAAALVDTRNLETRGLPVAEVSGACFCCHFDQLAHRIHELIDNVRPDIVLAEPVGSCTDLVATVIRPLRRFQADAIEVAPFLVVLKPGFARRVLDGRGSGGDIGYIFRKQLEEADLILINRSDELTPAQRDDLLALIARHYPDASIVIGSARTGEGLAALLDALDRRSAAAGRALDLDYDRYAAGEAELGWLNASVRVTAPRPLAVDKLLLDVIESLRRALQRDGAEAAHIKVMGSSGAACGVANWIGAGTKADLSRRSGAESRELELIVNARVVMDPAALQAAVRASVDEVVARRGGKAWGWKASSFRPGRPVPAYRFAAFA